jgi:hypothetical protein
MPEKSHGVYTAIVSALIFMSIFGVVQSGAVHIQAGVQWVLSAYRSIDPAQIIADNFGAPSLQKKEFKGRYMLHSPFRAPVPGWSSAGDCSEPKKDDAGLDRRCGSTILPVSVVCDYYCGSSVVNERKE